MSSHYKEIKVGKGTTLVVREKGNEFCSAYISIGSNGKDIKLRGNGKVIAFDDWDDLIAAIDENKAAYVKKDM